MVPGKRNINVYRGDTKYIGLKLTRRFEEEDGSTRVEPMDLTGLTFNAQIRVDPNSSSVEAEFDTLIPDQSEYPGELTLVLPAEQSANLNVPQMAWDVQSTDMSGVVQTWLYGNVTVLFDVTRPGE